MNTKKQDEHTASHTHPTPSPRGRDGEGLRQGILFLSLLLLLLCTGAKPLRAQTAQVTRTWLEHGVTQNGEQGMMVHVEFDVQGMKGVSGKAVAFIDSPKGTGWKDTNGQYCTNTGNVCASTIFKPSYDNSHYSDLNIFFPYGELHLAPGKKEYFCTVYIHDSNKYIAHGEFVSFTGTGSSGNTPAPQQQAGSRRAAFPNGQTLYFANEADRRVFWMEFSYDNEGDAICVWPMRMPATRFVLKSRDSQGFHFKEYTFGMEMQTTSTLFGNITGPTGRMVKQERNQEFVLANDLGCIYMFGLRYEAVSKQEYSRIFSKINGGYSGGYSGGTSVGTGGNDTDAGRSTFRDGPCKYCSGSGRCTKCQGSGSIYSVYGGEYITCPSCSGSGRCFNCHGTGKQRTY